MTFSSGPFELPNDFQPKQKLSRVKGTIPDVVNLEALEDVGPLFQKGTLSTFPHKMLKVPFDVFAELAFRIHSSLTMSFVRGPDSIRLYLIPEKLSLGRRLSPGTFGFDHGSLHFSAVLFAKMVTKELLDHDFFALLPVVKPQIFHVHQFALYSDFSGVQRAELVFAKNVL